MVENDTKQIKFRHYLVIITIHFLIIPYFLLCYNIFPKFFEIIIEFLCFKSLFGKFSPLLLYLIVKSLQKKAPRFIIQLGLSINY